MAAADATAGRMAGQVTWRKARHREAPSTARRLLGARVEPLPQAPDGAHDDGVVEEGVGQDDRHRAPRRSTPRRPRGPRRERKAAPTTTVGRTKGTTSSAWRRRRPRNS